MSVLYNVYIESQALVMKVCNCVDMRVSVIKGTCSRLGPMFVY